MDIEFDPDKDAINVAKHGVSLAFGARIWDDWNLVIAPAMRPRDGEERRKAIGYIDGKLWTAVHVERGEIIRLISVRRSNDPEARGYHRNPG